MDVMSLLKTVPAAIGIAGLVTYLMRARAPVSNQELVNVVQRVRNTFLLLGCAALIMLSVWFLLLPTPPDHDATLSGEHSRRALQRSFDGHMRGCPSSTRVAAKRTVPASDQGRS